MSDRFPGGFITKTPVVPTVTSASGVWTLDQAMVYIKAGTWPTPPQGYIMSINAGSTSAQNIELYNIAIDPTTKYALAVGTRIKTASTQYYAPMVTVDTNTGTFVSAYAAGNADYDYGYPSSITIDSSNLYMGAPRSIGKFSTTGSTEVWRNYMTATQGSYVNGYLYGGALYIGTTTYHLGSYYWAVGGCCPYSYTSFINTFDSSGTSLAKKYITQVKYMYQACSDSSGNIYVAGADVTFNANSGGFVTKLSTSSGLAVTWSKWDQGSNSLYYASVAVDSSGNVFSGGWGQQSTNSYPLITKRNSSGVLQWSVYFTAISGGYPFYGLTTDSSGNVYGVVSTSAYGTLIVKINSSGSIQWTRQFTLGYASSNPACRGICMDSTGMYIIIVGTYSPGAPTYLSNSVIAKLPADGSMTGTYTISQSGNTYNFAYSNASSGGGNGTSLMAGTYDQNTSSSISNIPTGPSISSITTTSTSQTLTVTSKVMP